MRLLALAALLAAGGGPAVAEDRGGGGSTSLIAPSRAVSSGAVPLRGSTAVFDKVSLDPGYARATLLVTGPSGSFSVPVEWSEAPPPTLRPGRVLHFTASVPVDRLLLRCAPPDVAACRFEATGPFPSGIARLSLPVPDGVPFFVAQDAATLAHWTGPRTADRGDFAQPGMPRYLPGLLFAQFASGTSLDEAEAMIASAGLRIATTVAGPTPKLAFTLAVPVDVPLEDALARLQAKVLLVQPIFVR